MQPINRGLLKENAKLALKNNFWIIMAVVIVGSFLGCNWSGIARNNGSANVNVNTGTGSTQKTLIQVENVINKISDSDFTYDYDEDKSDVDNLESFYATFLEYFNMTHQDFMKMLRGAVAIILAIVIIINILLAIIQFVIGSFVSAPIGVGVSNFFMRNRKGIGRFTDMFSAFNKGKYMNTVKGMFSSNIRMFGWSLLFYFPGLVKYYQMYFMSYIMAENPSISPARAREISSKMTEGHKWQIFVLELSFLGWILLATLLFLIVVLCSCGLLAIPGMLLLYPVTAYQYATFAELYAERREYALVNGLASEQELSGF